LLVEKKRRGLAPAKGAVITWRWGGLRRVRVRGVQRVTSVDQMSRTRCWDFEAARRDGLDLGLAAQDPGAGGVAVQAPCQAAVDNSDNSDTDIARAVGGNTNAPSQ
jgi:hypothetical protein